MSYTRKKIDVCRGVAVFKENGIQGEVVLSDRKQGVSLVAVFTKLPPGPHGFHIHKAGDLRGEGCMGLCEHYDIGHHCHGGPLLPRKNVIQVIWETLRFEQVPIVSEKHTTSKVHP